MQITSDAVTKKCNLSAEYKLSQQKGHMEKGRDY